MQKKISDVFLCLSSLFISLALMFGLFLKNDKSFSERENRSLTERPRLTLTNLIRGKYFSELSNYCTDQFPARDLFTTVSTVGDLSLLRNEANGIIIGNNGFLIPRYDYNELNTLTENCNAILKFLEAGNQNGTPTYILVAPRSIDVNSEQLPKLYPYYSNRDVYKILDSKIPQKFLIETESILKESANTEAVWYRTDHHWTTNGAYYAYEALSERLGYNAYPKEYFNITTVSNSFLGTSFSRSGLNSFYPPDTIELYRYKGDDDIIVTEPSTGTSRQGFYDFSALDKNDKYRVFLGGNTDILQIRDIIKNKPKLLLIKDSFANSVIPFLSIHFDIDVIDLRYFKGSANKYIFENDFDYIMLIYGIDTLASDISCSYIIK